MKPKRIKDNTVKLVASGPRGSVYIGPTSSLLTAFPSASCIGVESDPYGVIFKDNEVVYLDTMQTHDEMMEAAINIAREFIPNATFDSKRRTKDSVEDLGNGYSIHSDISTEKLNGDVRGLQLRSHLFSDLRKDGDMVDWISSDDDYEGHTFHNAKLKEWRDKYGTPATDSKRRSCRRVKDASDNPLGTTWRDDDFTQDMHYLSDYIQNQYGGMGSDIFAYCFVFANNYTEAYYIKTPQNIRRILYSLVNYDYVALKETSRGIKVDVANSNDHNIARTISKYTTPDICQYVYDRIYV